MKSRICYLFSKCFISNFWGNVLFSVSLFLPFSSRNRMKKIYKNKKMRKDNTLIIKSNIFNTFFLLFSRCHKLEDSQENHYYLVEKIQMTGFVFPVKIPSGKFPIFEQALLITSLFSHHVHKCGCSSDWLVLQIGWSHSF